MTIDTPTRTAQGPLPTQKDERRRLDDRIPFRLMLAVAALWAASLYVVFSLAPAPTTEDPQ